MTAFNDVTIFGLRISNHSHNEAIALIEQMILERRDAASSIFIANTHTLNLAHEDRYYHAVLSRANKVFADGTGARWAARLRGVKLKANLVGTDLVPNLFEATAGKGYRYFLLGGRKDTVENAAKTCVRLYPGWSLVGFQHGYLNERETAQTIDDINAVRPDLLLVAMGNPLQERWIDKHRSRLTVPVRIGVGGLIDHWAGNLTRAPHWVRRHGCEWVQILLQQPHKWRRYIVGNPKFLFRIVRELSRDQRIPIATDDHAVNVNVLGSVKSAVSNGRYPAGRP